MVSGEILYCSDKIYRGESDVETGKEITVGATLEGLYLNSVGCGAGIKRTFQGVGRDTGENKPEHTYDDGREVL